MRHNGNTLLYAFIPPGDQIVDGLPRIAEGAAGTVGTDTTDRHVAVRHSETNQQTDLGNHEIRLGDIPRAEEKVGSPGQPPGRKALR